MSDPIALADCLAWLERYKETPWNSLALSTAAARDHSPIKVMASLGFHVQALAEAAEEAREWLRKGDAGESFPITADEVLREALTRGMHTGAVTEPEGRRVTTWRIVSVPSPSDADATLEMFPDAARGITLSVDSTAPAILEAIEAAAAAHGIELEREVPEG